MNNNDMIFNQALEELQHDIRLGIERWSDAHLTAYKKVGGPKHFLILNEYYKEYKAQDFIPCELTFRMWYKINYEQDK